MPLSSSEREPKWASTSVSFSSRTGAGIVLRSARGQSSEKSWKWVCCCLLTFVYQLSLSVSQHERSRSPPRVFVRVLRKRRASCAWIASNSLPITTFERAKKLNNEGQEGWKWHLSAKSQTWCCLNLPQPHFQPSPALKHSSPVWNPPWSRGQAQFSVTHRVSRARIKGIMKSQRCNKAPVNVCSLSFQPRQVSGGTFSLVFILSSDGCCGFHCKDAALTTGISYTCGA